MINAVSRLILVRHGEAEPTFADDKSRCLTDKGREQVLTASKVMVNQMTEYGGFDRALVSPYTRTQQTFDILSIHLKVGSKVNCSLVTPNSSVADAQREIFRQLAECSSLLLVTHMPLVSFLTSELCHLDTPPLFMTSSFAVIDIEQRQGAVKLIDLVHQQG
jgi:phosphohistidine phosphatase